MPKALATPKPAPLAPLPRHESAEEVLRRALQGLGPVSDEMKSLIRREIDARQHSEKAFAPASAADLAAHIADAADAHDASAISADSATLVGTGTDVQAVLEELDNGIADHLAATSALIRVIDADQTGTDVATAQPWFPTLGSVTVAAATTYMFEGQLMVTRAAGTTSHTTGLLFAGSATLTGIQYFAVGQIGDTDGNLAASKITSRVATNSLFKGASVSATEAFSLSVRGIVRINAAGTFIPQFIYSAAPGGVPTIKANSFFQMTPLGSNTFASQGAWS